MGGTRGLWWLPGNHHTSLWFTVPVSCILVLSEMVFPLYVHKSSRQSLDHWTVCHVAKVSTWHPVMVCTRTEET